MSLPSVAIVGRPNVGKSSLLNMLVGQRVSIVAPTAGVTRDRVSTICEFDDRYFELIDTGGYGIEDHDDLTEHVEGQIRIAVTTADLILFVVDVQTGILPLDVEVARMLREATPPVLLVSNKVDDVSHEPGVGGFAALGFGESVQVSALHRHGRRDLAEHIFERLGNRLGTEAPDPLMKIALVGRRNVGKSSFVNSLAGQNRVIVSEVPGTTRDSIDVRFKMGDREFIAIDTAGVRKRRRFATDIEHYGFDRVLGAIRRADVILFLIDATVPIGEVDKKLARSIVDQYKPVVIVVNKWDLAKGRAEAEAYGHYLAKTMLMLDYAPIAFTTATEGRNIQSTIDLAASLFKQARTRVTTGVLNRAVADALAERQPIADKHGAHPKLYFATQISTCPPTIIFFVNNPGIVREQYRRFVASRVREALPFDEIPVRFYWRLRKSNEADRPGRKGSPPRR